MTWIIAGGGTGGHITPALAIGEELRTRGYDILFIGTDRGMERRLVPENGFELVLLPSRPFIGRTLLGRLRAIVALLWTVLLSMREILRHRCQIVIAVGGYASMPPAIAGWLLRKPVALLNPDAEPGLANRVLSRIATRVFAGFPNSEKHFAHPERVRTTGVPLRRALREAFAQSATAQREPGGKRHLFVFGGSLGSRQINDALLAAAPSLKADRLHIVHQTGEQERSRVQEGWRQAGFEAEVVAFEKDMPRRYAWADLVVCRAGAISVAELTLAGCPAILIPLAHVGGGEQAANAHALEAAGGALVLDGAQFDAAAFTHSLMSLLDDPERLSQMATASRSLARPRAVEEIVDHCRDLLAGGQS